MDGICHDRNEQQDRDGLEREEIAAEECVADRARGPELMGVLAASNLWQLAQLSVP